VEEIVMEYDNLDGVIEKIIDILYIMPEDYAVDDLDDNYRITAIEILKVLDIV
jgi:hypothetical protein